MMDCSRSGFPREICQPLLGEIYDNRPMILFSINFVFVKMQRTPSRHRALFPSDRAGGVKIKTPVNEDACERGRL